jgi:hypothetical protein
VKLSQTLALLLLLILAGCASIKAPDMAGSSWSGQDGSRLNAQLRYTSGQLPAGWLHKTQQADASGAFAYRKRSGVYDYSERGYFSVDPQWRKDRTYFGLLKPGGIFCVANPEQQSSETEDASTDMTTITFWTVYDYCAQLHGP